ncbi:MAG: extracellular solute-binding protein [Tissierellia bacterium]|nr:extracellular solute-binding protein [Tissierellia bacterium]
MRKIISFILIGFILIWSYNLFINNFVGLEEVVEEPYKGIIEIKGIDIDGFSRWLMPKIRNFERYNPGVYIEFIPADENNMGDIIPINYESFDLSILESLDEYFEKEELEKFREEVIKSLYYNEQLLGVPVGLSTYAMYLNLDKFNENGMSPPLNGDWTYEEFVETLKKFGQYPQDNDIIKEYPLLAPMDIRNYNIWGLMLSPGGEFINYKRMKYNFYGEKAIKGLENLIELKFKYGILPDFFGIINEEISQEMFYKDQNVAVYIGDSRFIRKLDNQYKAGNGFNFEIANFPTEDKNLPNILSNGIFSYGIVKSEDRKKVEMCVKFLKYLTRDSNQKTLEDIGLFTVKNNIKDMYMDNVKMKRIEESLDYTKYIPLMDNYLEMERIIHEEIKAAILGEKKSYEAIEGAKVKVESLSK